MSTNDLDEKINTLRQVVTNSESSGDFREAWEVIREVGAAFKETRYPTRERHNAAWDRFQETIDRVKVAQAKHRDRQAAAMEKIVERIVALRSEVEESAKRVNWREVWAEIRAITQEFKVTRFPSKSEREAAWTQFQEVVARVKSIQEMQQDRHRDLDALSQRHKEFILWHVHRAHPLNEIASALFDAPAGVLDQFLPGPALDFRKDELKCCSSELHQARVAFSERKGEMLGRDKHAVHEAILEAQHALDAAWQSYRELHQAAFEARQSAWQERKRQRVSNLGERLSGLYDKLSNAEAHLEKLEHDRDGAWNDSFRERVEGWIEEAHSRISGLREKIRQVEGWLDEEQSR